MESSDGLPLEVQYVPSICRCGSGNGELIEQPIC
jgi:hypothetical protein